MFITLTRQQTDSEFPYGYDPGPTDIYLVSIDQIVTLSRDSYKHTIVRLAKGKPMLVRETLKECLELIADALKAKQIGTVPALRSVLRTYDNTIGDDQ